MIQPQNALRVTTGAVLCIFHVIIQLPLRFGSQTVEAYPL
jgi:hypothetical protein